MFQIRPEVATSFREKAVAGHRANIANALRADQPDLTAPYSEEQTLQLTDYAMERADWYGLHAEYSVYVFSVAMLCFGFDFDTNPNITWTRELLDDPTHDEDVKVKLLELRIATDAGRVL